MKISQQFRRLGIENIVIFPRANHPTVTGVALGLKNVGYSCYVSYFFGYECSISCNSP
jgi:hypothetical protein